VGCSSFVARPSWKQFLVACFRIDLGSHKHNILRECFCAAELQCLGVVVFAYNALRMVEWFVDTCCTQHPMCKPLLNYCRFFDLLAFFSL
jgi:hypothetical protein